MFKADTEMIASLLMGWFRFGKQYHYVAREVGEFASDILASNGRTVVEVEIKVSKSDFRADWKKDKHRIYKKRIHVHTHTYPNGYKIKYDQPIPNQFYFACPGSMKKFAIEQVKTKQPEYGIIILEDSSESTELKKLKVIKRAKFMHRKPPEPKLLERLVARMSSDLANVHLNRRMDKDWLRLAIDNSKAFSQMSDIEKIKK